MSLQMGSTVLWFHPIIISPVLHTHNSKGQVVPEHAMKVYGRSGAIILVLDGDYWLGSCLGCFTLRESEPSTQ